MNEFQKRFRLLCDEQNIIQKYLAEDLNMSQQKVSTWATGRNEPNIDDLIKLADYLGVTVGQLIGSEKLN